MASVSNPPVTPMNKLQKIILSLYAAVILAMFLIPPHQRNILRTNGTVTQDLGYRYIWDAALPGTTNSSSNTVNFQLLGIQMLVASLVAAALWLLVKDGNPLRGWSAPKGLSVRRKKRTVLAFFVCVSLYFLYFIGGGMVFHWKHGGGAIPMAIATSIIVAIWRAIRGTDTLTTTGPTGNSSTPSAQSTKKHILASSSVSSTQETDSLSAFELLAKEKETGFRHEALWLKCFSEADGDTARAEAAYNRERASWLASQASTKAVSEHHASGTDSEAHPEQPTIESVKSLQAPKNTNKALNLIAWAIAALALLFFVTLFKREPNSQVTNEQFYAPAPSEPANSLPQAVSDAAPPRTIAQAPMPASKGSLEHASIGELVPLAEKGNIEAQLVLGLNFVNGIKVPKNETEAYKWFLKAAEQGEPAAQGNVGTMLHDGKGVQKDGLQALEWWRKAAAQNDLLSQYNLGVSYEFGEGVQQDFRQALQWYEKAATQGFARAQHNLGFLYREGRGVAKDASKAFNLFKEAAEQNHVASQHAIGVCYHHGEGVTKNLSEAIKWLTKAALQNWPESQYDLWCMYRDGDGVDKNLTEAFEWLQKAAEQGDAPAQADLGISYRLGIGVEKEPATAVRWLQKAADQGDRLAQYHLGEIFLNGEGLTPDVAKAAKWFRMAAEQGNADAQANLGQLLIIGTGVPQDYTEGVEWMSKAAVNGNLYGQFRLGNIYILGQGVKKDVREGLKWLTPLLEKVTLQNGQDNSFALDIINDLAIALNEAGRRKEALELLRSKSAFSTEASERLRYNLACYECLEGNLDEAIRLVAKHLKLHPEEKEQAMADSDLAAIRSVLQKL